MELSEQWRLLTGGESERFPSVSLVLVEGAGRGLAVTQAVEGGTVVLSDRAVVVGPSPLSSPSQCDGCFSRTAGEQCEACSAVFCSADCRRERHTAEECRALRSLPVPTPSPALWLMILRLHLSQDPRLSLLTGHTSSPSTEKYCKETLARLGISETEAARLQAVLSANTFRNNTARCLCPVMAMVNHSCDPNCRVYWRSSDTLVLETRRAVRAGEELTITYCCGLLGTPARQAKLLSTKGFQCRCERCQDPGERRTNMGGINCTKCGQGIILPSIGNSPTSPLSWVCECGFTPNTAKVSKFLDKLEEEIQYIDMMEENNGQQIETKISRYEQFLEKKSRLLPSKSYLLIQVAGSLGILLAKSKKANTLQVLLKREKLAKKRLEVIDILDQNSRSRQKGFELFRYHQVLTQKKQIVGEKFQDSDQAKLEESLVESYILLKDDINCPAPLEFCYDKMASALGIEREGELTLGILSKYK